MGMFNEVRLRSAIGYITPQEKLLRRAEAIFAERQAKLTTAAAKRAIGQPEPYRAAAA